MAANDQNKIRITGARQHNLKNISLELPRDQLIVFTGISGSGKSSLAFDTIFAEGQRRYVESLSAYARQFLGQLDKPEVDAIEGLSPAISIDQKSTSNNPRSTVGTVTEIYDYFRLLFGRAGLPHCPQCDRAISPQTIDEMCDRVMALPDKTKFQILAPVMRGKKGTHQKLLSSLVAGGFVRVRINGEIRELADQIELDKNQKHSIEIVIDRLVKKAGINSRLADSLGTCLKQSEGMAVINILADDAETADLVFSERFACPEHGAVMEELSPRLFSFNSPYGACPDCHGLGNLRLFAAELVIPDPTAQVYCAILPWSDKDNSYYLSLLYSLGQAYDFELSTKWQDLTPAQQQLVLQGTNEPVWMEQIGEFRHFRGVLKILQRQYDDGSELQKQRLDNYLVDRPCPVCAGDRLKPEALSVKMGQYNILDFTNCAIDQCLERINQVTLNERQAKIAELVLQEIRARLRFLLDVGLDYLTLSRSATTLSGGSALV
jgi:excinuclease ABC subunit A